MYGFYAGSKGYIYTLHDRLSQNIREWVLGDVHVPRKKTLELISC